MPSTQTDFDRGPRGPRLAIAAMMLACVAFPAQAQDPGQRGGPVAAPPPPPDPAPPPPPPPVPDASLTVVPDGHHGDGYDVEPAGHRACLSPLHPHGAGSLHQGREGPAGAAPTG